jgi:AraC-like DNA-binding protein/mannose-6-phosphate isomerase-like protein (cupin superfamily)
MAQNQFTHTIDAESFLGGISFSCVEIESLTRFDGRDEATDCRSHSHTCFELLFFVEGRARILAGSSTLEASISDLVIYPPDTPHEERLAPEVKQDIFRLRVDVGQAHPFDRGLLFKDVTGTIRQLFEIMYVQHRNPRSLTADLIRTCIQTLFLLLRQYSAEGLKPEALSIVERCSTYIREHLNEGFTIDDIANAIYVSPSYLFRAFKKKTGTTPMHYRNLQRIEKAKLLLSEGSNGRLDVIAQMVGFNDVKYFSNLFRKSTGQTPGSFRKVYAPTVG